MTLAYWSRVGGTLIEEYVIVPPGAGRGVRLVDAIILADGPTTRLPIDAARHVELAGCDVIVVQTKGSRLGMYLLGQAYFSKLLVERRFKPRSVRSVAVCTATDAALEPIAAEHGVEVVVVNAGTSSS
jgi:hypothetical protein